jgi:hypothetical protein
MTFYKFLLSTFHAILLSISFVLAANAEDVFTPINDPNPVVGCGFDGVDCFKRSDSYNPFGDKKNPLNEGANWETTLASSLVFGGPAHDLNVKIQHKGGPLFEFKFAALFSDFIRIKADQTSHGANSAVDVAKATVANGAVTTMGNHYDKPQKLKWSLHNNAPAGGNNLTNIKVVPSYRMGNGDIYEDINQVSSDNRKDIPPGGEDEGGFKPTVKVDGQKGTLSDYRISAIGSPLSEASLAFIGNVDGILNELDLGAATSLFTDIGEFLVPMFANDVNDPLYIGVDLGQWLTAISFGTAFFPSYLDTFNISNGVSSNLPGFLFSTSPLEFLAGTGWVTSGASSFNTPLDGSVYMRATIDGSVPEPSTLTLIMAGICVLRLRSILKPA